MRIRVRCIHPDVVAWRNKHGEFYIVMQGEDTGPMYLHADGAWLDVTSSQGGWTGYYDTLDQAREALALAGVGNFEIDMEAL